MNARMLGAYYTKGMDCSTLFGKLKIAKEPDYDKNRNCYNVIFIDFSRLPDVCQNYENYIFAVIEGLYDNKR